MAAKKKPATKRPSSAPKNAPVEDLDEDAPVEAPAAEEPEETPEPAVPPAVPPISEFARGFAKKLLSTMRDNHHGKLAGSVLVATSAQKLVMGALEAAEALETICAGESNEVKRSATQIMIARVEVRGSDELAHGVGFASECLRAARAHAALETSATKIDLKIALENLS